MNCDFTEEVSLLVDGELAPHEAARLGAHVEGCAACRQARESFLLLRQELRSYEWAPDPDVQRAALSTILNANTSTSVRASGFFGSLAEAFGALRLRPAHVFTLALLLTGAALGLLWLKRSNNSPDVPAIAKKENPPVQANEHGEKQQENLKGVESPIVSQAETPQPPHRAGKVRGVGNPRRREALSREAPQETARVEVPTRPLPSASVATVYAAVSLRAAAADDPSMRVGRHAERVERLLRSFRNARLTGGDPTLDLPEARRLSKRLLYTNIALRREAASEGDLPVEGLLDSVEPVLIDISNLPDAPSPAALGSIRERINRRHLVGALQAQGMLVSR
jgi:hypothetical protein